MSSHFDRSTTHVVFPREVDYQSGMDSLQGRESREFLETPKSRERRESMDGERMRTNGNSKGTLGISKWRRSLRFLHQSLIRL